MAGDVGRRGAVAEFEALLCRLEEEARIYVVEQGEDRVHPISGLAVEGVEDLGDPSLGDALQGAGRRLELLGADVGTEFVFEFHLTQRGIVVRRWRPRKEFKLLRVRKGFAVRSGSGDRASRRPTRRSRLRGRGGEDPLGSWKGSSIGDGWAGFASRKNPRPEPGMSDLCGHLFGGARRAVVLVRVGFGLRGGGAGGLGDAGNEALDQLDRTLHGAAGVGADVLVGREGDHEVEDAPGGIAGSDGDGWSCCTLLF